MLLSQLRASPVTRNILCDECSENAFKADLNPVINPIDYVIIKVDSYYNSLPMEERIPAPDCLIVVRCGEGEYSIYVVELKDISGLRGFETRM